MRWGSSRAGLGLSSTLSLWRASSGWCGPGRLSSGVGRPSEERPDVCRSRKGRRSRCFKFQLTPVVHASTGGRTEGAVATNLTQTTKLQLLTLAPSTASGNTHRFGSSGAGGGSSGPGPRWRGSRRGEQLIGNPSPRVDHGDTSVIPREVFAGVRSVLDHQHRSDLSEALNSNRASNAGAATDASTRQGTAPRLQTEGRPHA